MISSKIFFKKSEIHGLGMFANQDIEAEEIIEIAPIIILKKEDEQLLDQTKLYDYYFDWFGKPAIVLGYGFIYNHSYESNAYYVRDIENETIIFKARKKILASEEIRTNYNGDPEDKTKVWFDK